MGCLKLTYRSETPTLKVVRNTLKESEKPCAGAYRFGFNGQEKDDEITGTTGSHYTATFWEYDSRIGRRWNLDPVDQVSISNYTTFANNPIFLIDPLGNLATKFEDEEGNLLHETNDGVDATVEVSNEKIDDFVEEIGSFDKDELRNMQQEKERTIDLASKYMPNSQCFYYTLDDLGQIRNLTFTNANINNVQQIGLRISGGIGTTMTLGGGVVWDNKGNIGLYGSVGGGTGVDGSIGLEYTSNTSYDDINIYNINGLSVDNNASLGIFEYSSGGSANQQSFTTKTGLLYDSQSVGLSISPFLIGGGRNIENTGVIKLISTDD